VIVDRDGTGFTLVEVMVALLIGGMVVAGAAGLLSALGNRVQAIERAAARADEDANGERLLRTLVANLEFGADTTTPSFVGDLSSALFRSWCETPAGWLDHCTVRLAFESQKSTTVLKLELRGAYSTILDLRRGFRNGRLRYLQEVDRRLSWVDTWSQRIAPRGLAVIIDRDTLLLPVGGGG